MYILTLFFVARDEVKAVRMLDDLKEAGFPRHSISVLVPERSIAGGFGVDERSAEGAATRAKPLDGALEKLDDVGILTSPDLGRVMGAGRLMIGLNAPTAVSRTADNTDAFQRAGISRDLAQNYEKCLADGKIVMAITCDEPAQARHLEELLNSAGADYIAWSASSSTQMTVADKGSLEEAA